MPRRRRYGPSHCGTSRAPGCPRRRAFWDVQPKHELTGVFKAPEVVRPLLRSTPVAGVSSMIYGALAIFGRDVADSPPGRPPSYVDGEHARARRQPPVPLARRFLRVWGRKDRRQWTCRTTLMRWKSVGARIGAARGEEWSTSMRHHRSRSSTTSPSSLTRQRRVCTSGTCSSTAVSMCSAATGGCAVRSCFSRLGSTHSVSTRRTSRCAGASIPKS